VALFGYAFDYVPTNFTKDLLVHEAHRHPYMERLAQTYLMKLRNPHFGSNVGAVWRQLFVLALMPWMKKHRIFSEERISQAMEALSIRRMEEVEDAKALHKRFGEDVVGMAEAVGTAGAQTAAVTVSSMGHASAGAQKVADLVSFSKGVASEVDI
jgi:hypothetical protein